jgi:hypothetical protein
MIGDEALLARPNQRWRYVLTSISIASAKRRRSVSALASSASAALRPSSSCLPHTIKHGDIRVDIDRHPWLSPETDRPPRPAGRAGDFRAGAFSALFGQCKREILYLVPWLGRSRRPYDAAIT